MNKTIYYNHHFTFPHLLWKLEVKIPRNFIPKICQQLYGIVHERIGSTFYDPDFTSNKINCRYEWIRKYNKNKIGTHLGIYFIVGDNDLEEIFLYLTTNEAIYNNQAPLPKFSNKFIKIIQNEIIQTFKEAVNCLKEDAFKTRYVIFYIESHYGIEEEFETEDKKVKVFPSSSIQGKIVSPVLISTSAPSNQRAKPTALHEIAYFCAFHTLANGQLCQTIDVKWPKRKSKIDFLDALDIDDINILYPNRTKPAVIFNNNVPIRIKLIWGLYHKLMIENKDNFLKALFAFYSAYSIMHKYSTLSIVAYISSLSCLTSTVKCSGNITCSLHGKLSFKHNVVGETKAILNLINSLFNLTTDQENEISSLIKRIYQKHRSAFVHGAELRFGEFHKDCGVPTATPNDNSIVKDEFFYKQDFMAFQLLTRLILLKWLHVKNGVELDYDLFDLDKLLLKKYSAMESSFVIPNIVVAPFHDGIPK